MNQKNKADPRKLKNLTNNIKKVENRVNAKIVKRMKELAKDPIFMKTTDSELKDLKTQKDYEDYIAQANQLAARENDDILKNYGNTE